MSIAPRHRIAPLATLVALFLIPFSVQHAQAGELEHSVRLDRGDVVVSITESRVEVADPRFTLLAEEGEPVLPYRLVNLVIPQGHDVASWEFLAGPAVTLAEAFTPRLGDRLISVEGKPGKPAGLAASADGMFPGTRGRYLGTGVMHGVVIASFAVFPLKMSGGSLELTEEITIKVTTAPLDGSRRLAMRIRHRSGFRDRVENAITSMVDNAQDMVSYSFPSRPGKEPMAGFRPTAAPSLEGSAVDYVIITNDSLASAYQRLADWKTQKGVRTVIRTTEWIEANYVHGADQQETIRNFIRDAYEKWGITYVMLGGDTGEIPARLGATFFQGDKDVPVDMYFSCLDGDWNADHDSFFGEVPADSPDLYPEVVIGRLPTSSVGDVKVLTDKIITYETPVDTDFSAKILMLAEVLFPINWNQVDPPAVDGAELAEFIDLLAFGDTMLTVTKLYENSGGYPGSIQETVQTSLDSINTGYGFVHHIGHGFRFNMSVGNGSIVNSHADEMVNGNRLSNFYLLNCTAVAYTYYCLAEHLLKNPTGGAVSAVGSNESAFPLVSQPYMNEYYHQIFNEGVVRVGEAFALSRLPRTPIAALGDNGDLWTHYIYSILADPEMPQWTSSVEPFNVVLPPSVGMGASAVNIQVADSGGPFAGATVCLSKGLEDYEVGVTDGAGMVAFDFTVESPGSVLVVVTGPNRIRSEKYIPVSSGPSAYVSFASLDVKDDGSGSTVGNGDNNVDAGETVAFTVSAHNSGSLGSGVVAMALRSVTPGVIVVDSLASVGNVPAGQVVQATDPFLVSFAPTIGDGVVAEFSLVVSEGGIETWADEMSCVVRRPDLSMRIVHVDDSGLGNGDGVNQDNEEFLLFYQVKNVGSGAAYGLSAAIEDLDDGFVFTDSLDSYPAATPGETSSNVAGFHIRETNTALASRLRITVTDAYGRSVDDTFELRRPTPPVNITFDPSLGPDRIQLAWDASADPDVDRYCVYRSLSPGGPYALATADPVFHRVFVDRPLQSTTRYYYVLTAVDTSGNESSQSVEFTGSTNPGQLQGFPITMELETVSSPVIGDIDGDLDLEVVQGNGALYAWHHTGEEMIDKDGNAQTYGLLTTVGSAYVSHVALAEIDSVPGFDIIAASRDTKEVYVFNYLGDPLPGWPQPVENTIRAGLVAGDLNGDETKEIIAIDELGVMYVWDASGNEFIDGDMNPLTPGVFRRFPGCIYQYTSPAIGDFDQDNLNEIIIGTQGDSVYVVNHDGTNMPGWPMGFSSDISGSIAIGDIDGDGGGDLEIVVPEWGGLVHALHHTGATLWIQWFSNQLSFGPSPALGDINKDGTLETVVASKNRNLYVLGPTGNPLPGWPVTYTDNLWTESSPIIADFDADGSLDIVLGDETRFINGWDAWGNVLSGFPLASGDAVRATPTVGDVDKDGDVDLVVAGWDKAVYIYDFPKRFDPRMAPWSGFHANLYNDGNTTTKLPTPVATVSFSYEALDGGVRLLWQIPPEAGYLFDIERAQMEQGREPGEDSFGRIASGVAVDVGGTLRYVDSGAQAGTRYFYRVRSVDDGSSALAGGSVYVPVIRAKLGQNYPNPFNPRTTIEYWVAEGPAQQVSVVIYDVRGARVRTLVNEPVRSGRHVAEWDGRNDGGERVGSGMYFYRMVQGSGFTDTRKMMLLK